MDWLVRFSLGLPARSEDVKAVSELLPELARGEVDINHRLIFWPSYRPFISTEEFIALLKEWIHEVEEYERVAYGHESRWIDECPLRTRGMDGAAVGAPSEPQVFRLLVAAGGPNAKASRESFFDLVRRTHPEADPPREVILTDPYVYTDVSEDGLVGGFKNLLLYLQTLGLTAEDKFTLTTTPSPKRGGVTAKRNLQRLLRKEFPQIDFKDFSPRLNFHDRFYVVRHRSGGLRGVFGPSLNGLSSDAIVIMGDIDGSQPLKKIYQWLQ